MLAEKTDRDDPQPAITSGRELCRLEGETTTCACTSIRPAATRQWRPLCSRASIVRESIERLFEQQKCSRRQVMQRPRFDLCSYPNDIRREASFQRRAHRARMKVSELKARASTKFSKNCVSDCTPTAATFDSTTTTKTTATATTTTTTHVEH
jgi:hypothetical protein